MEPILIFVDAFETFYQMPINVWESFKNTKEHNNLLELGYSEHVDGFKFFAPETNDLNKLIENL
jgi:hypothetical protein